MFHHQDAYREPEKTCENCRHYILKTSSSLMRINGSTGVHMIPGKAQPICRCYGIEVDDDFPAYKCPDFQLKHEILASYIRRRQLFKQHT